MAKQKATILQKKAIAYLAKHGGTVTRAMRSVGYKRSTYRNTVNLTETPIFKSFAARLSDDVLAKKHLELLNSTFVDHMVFPLESPELTDEHIGELLEEVNCKIRKIVHGETSRHVYFWAADNKARKDGLDMAFKIKGAYAPEKSINVNVEVQADPIVKDLTEKINALYRGTGSPSDGRTPGAMGTQAQDQK